MILHDLMIVMVYELGKCLFSSEVRTTMQVWLLPILLSRVQEETKEGVNEKERPFCKMSPEDVD